MKFYGLCYQQIIFTLPDQVTAYLLTWLGRLCLIFHGQTINLCSTSCLYSGFLFKATAKMELGLGNSKLNLGSFFPFPVFLQLSRIWFCLTRIWNWEHFTAWRTLQVFNCLEYTFTDTFSYSQAYPYAMQVMCLYYMKTIFELVRRCMSIFKPIVSLKWRCRKKSLKGEFSLELVANDWGSVWLICLSQGCGEPL